MKKTNKKNDIIEKFICKPTLKSNIKKWIMYINIFIFLCIGIYMGIIYQKYKIYFICKNTNSLIIYDIKFSCNKY